MVEVVVDVDEGQEPLEGATVIFGPSSANTGSDGRATVNPPSGPHELIVQKQGYQTLEDERVAEAGKVIDVSLARE